MKRNIFHLALILLALFLTTQPAVGQEPVESVQSGPVVNEQEMARERPLTELEQEIDQIRQVAQERLQALTEQLAGLDAGSDPAAEIRRQVAEIKQQAEIDVLEAIIADARIRGETERLAEAELALDRLQHPEKYKTPVTPVERPAPSQ
ncbi:MAG: hypothetical protein ABIF77_19265 [bacterium]